MQDKTEYPKDTIEAIRKQIKIFNWVVLLVIYALFFLVVRFLYIILNYIPPLSAATILGILAGLVVIGSYLANTASKRAIREIEEYSNKLNTILNTTRDIREIVYGDVLLDNIMESSLRLIGAEAGSILLVEGDRLVFKIVKGSASSKLVGLSIPISRGIAGWSVENARAIRVDDVKNDSRFNPEIDNITGFETRSAMCVPLRLSSGIIGVLELINKHGGTFTPGDEELISYLADQAAISIERARFYEDQKNYEIHLTNLLLDAIDRHIPEKRGHSKRLARYSLLIARATNMSEDEKKRLYRACLLHDIGFLKIDLEEVYSKDEYSAHSQMAYEIVRSINFYADIAPIILHHHERYDGNGYPSGLKGEAIPIESRIISIAEAFDAMVSKESYKFTGRMINIDIKPSIYGFYDAIEELKKSAGTQFDPKLVEIFLNNIDESSLEEI